MKWFFVLVLSFSLNAAYPDPPEIEQQTDSDHCGYLFRPCNSINHPSSTVCCGCFNKITGQNSEVNWGCFNHVTANNVGISLSCCNNALADQSKLYLTCCSTTSGEKSSSCCSAFTSVSGVEASTSCGCFSRALGQKAETSGCANLATGEKSYVGSCCNFNLASYLSHQCSCCSLVKPGAHGCENGNISTCCMCCFIGQKNINFCCFPTSDERKLVVYSLKTLICGPEKYAPPPKFETDDAPPPKFETDDAPPPKIEMD